MIRSDLFYTFFFILTLFILHASASKYKEKNCLVCQQIMREIVKDIEKENPKKKVQVGSLRIDADGIPKERVVKYAGSEIHFIEMFEIICERMNNYAQARHKETNRFAILNLETQINELQNYNLIQDVDLNRSIKFYCETIIDDHGDAITEYFANSSSLNVEEAIDKICWKESGFCSDEESIPDEDETYFHNEF